MQRSAVGGANYLVDLEVPGSIPGGGTIDFNGLLAARARPGLSP